VAEITMKDLLEAGVHFGHQTRRWNPQMKKFIFMERNGIYIIDLQRTMKCVEEARAAIEKVVRAGGHVLFVGTKKQAKPIVVEEAVRCGQFHVTERWLGGMLTNFKTIRTSIKRLHDRNKSAWWLLIFYLLPTVLPWLGLLIPGGSADPDAVPMAVVVLVYARFAIAIWALVELGCLRGTIGGNPFGPDPVAPRPAYH